MGQKVSPIGLRVGVIRDWESRWYADKEYADFLLEDVKIREFLFEELKAASVSRIEIERSKNRVEIMIRTARPGVIIGTNGEKIEDLVAYIKSKGVETMADCSTVEECYEAERIGFDCVSTTMFGYTPYSVKVEGPNIEAIKELVANLKVPLIAEGKINTPEDLKAVLEAGAYCAVVGGAITRPLQIAQRFAAVIK